ncbi:MAG TPA: hypothetical protein VIT20_02040 [Propionibacteriaceae bacterium]
MNSVNTQLGSAQVRFNDYVGTAAADDADAVLATRSLYEIAGLNRDRWTIVGLDLALGESAGVVVYAADRLHDAEAVEADEVPVTAFRLAPSTQLHAFIAEAFKRVSVRLVMSAVRDKQFVVAGQTELSEPAADAT